MHSNLTKTHDKVFLTYCFVSSKHMGFIFAHAVNNFYIP